MIRFLDLFLYTGLESRKACETISLDPHLPVGDLLGFTTFLCTSRVPQKTHKSDPCVGLQVLFGSRDTNLFLVYVFVS